jgi:transcriptional regulator with GAF, ATPase, and Fis domain
MDDLGATRPTLERRRAEAIADVERRLVFEALEHNAYNLSRAATALAMSRFGLRKRMRRLGLRVRRSVVSADTSSSLCEIAS